MNKNVEILSPAGDFECLKSAIAGGCNAVYLAGKMFGARSFAKNFTDEELVEAIKLCHLYNCKAYVTCNTICYERELPSVIKFIDFLYNNDVDAIICQDIGLASIIKHRYPNLSLHASTQMNAQTVQDVKVLKKLGFDRVILGREVSLDTIKKIKEEVDIELEVFVHGALCISYSGLCYFSLLEGGRSGNRGKCAQPCRKMHNFNNYDKYYLSPKDLCTINDIKEIANYVDSLKIEGRMKSKEYVYYTTSAYYKALNSPINNLSQKDIDKLLYPVKVAFNRGFTKGFINNEKNDKLTNVFSSNHLGEEIGQIINNDCKFKIPNMHQIKLKHDLLFNDSIRIVGKNTDIICVNQMYSNKLLIKKAEANNNIYIPLHKKMDIGDKVYITKREEDFELPKIIISGKAYLEKNNFVFEVKDGFNTVISKIPFETSDKDFTQRIIEQLNKTGSTPYTFSQIDFKCKNIYLNIKELNEMRRQILSRLTSLREKKNFQRKINNNELIIDLDHHENNYKTYSVCFNNYECNDGLHDYDMYYRNYKNKPLTGYYYIPRVVDDEFKTDEPVVSSTLGTLQNISSIYMNVVNSYSVRVLESLGITKVGLSFEMSTVDIKDLIKAYKERYQSVPNLEMMIYGHIQMMYMKHCFINKEFKMNKMHCNLCKKGLLLDNKYPLYGDSYCHLSILSEKPLNLINKIDEYKEIGVNHFLIDLINEQDDDYAKLSINEILCILEKRNK